MLPPRILFWRSLGSGTQESESSLPLQGTSRIGGKREGCSGQALQKQLVWMGEELGEKGTLDLETRKRHEGERSDESRPGSEPSLVPAQAAGCTSVTSVNEEAEGRQPRTLASWGWSLHFQSVGRRSGGIVCARSPPYRQRQTDRVLFALHKGSSAIDPSPAWNLLKAQVPHIPGQLH